MSSYSRHGSRSQENSKNDLTASRKNRRQPANTPELFDILDDMHDCCRIIATVAGLLEASDGEFLSPKVVPDAGTLIADAARELKIIGEHHPEENVMNFLHPTFPHPIRHR